MVADYMNIFFNIILFKNEVQKGSSIPSAVQKEWCISCFDLFLVCFMKFPPLLQCLKCATVCEGLFAEQGEADFSVFDLQIILARAAMFLSSSICWTSMTTLPHSQLCTKPLSVRGQKLARQLSVCLSGSLSVSHLEHCQIPKIPCGQQTQAAMQTGCKSIIERSDYQ